MIGFGAHPRNQFFGHVRRQNAGRAIFQNRILANVRPAERAPIYGTNSEREYGTTYPFQRFPMAVRVNRVDSIDATGYQVPPHSNTQRTGPLVGATVGGGSR